MRVIITGGTGSIGMPLSNELSQAGYDVIVLSRHPQSVPEKLSKSITVRQWDAKTGEGWFDLINHDTAIINLAGKNPANWRWTDTHKQQVLDSRIHAARAIVDACQKASNKPAVLLQASAVGYYGDTGEQEIREGSPVGNSWRAGVCVQWEAALQPIEAMGIRVAYMRIGIVLDSTGGALPPFILAAKLMGQQLGDGRQWIPWVHNADVSGAIRYLLENHNLNGVFNVCAPNPIRNRDMLKTLTNIISRPSLIPVPAFALKLAVGEMSNTVLDSQRVLPQALLDAGYSFRYPLLEPALRDLL